MLPTLQIGPLVLPVPGLVILAGLWIAISLSERRAVQNGISRDDYYTLIMISLGTGVIGARLAYVIQYPDAFQASPASLFSINLRLFDLTAGIAASFLGGFIFAARKHFAFWPTLDILTPGLAVMGITINVSHLASGAAYGIPTRLPWGVELWGEVRHPTQLYETISACLLLVAVLWLEKVVNPQKSGVLFWAFLGMSSASRLFWEAFRGDSTLIMAGFRQDQLIAWLVLGVSLIGLYRRLYISTSLEPVKA